VLSDGPISRAIHLAIGGGDPDPDAAQCRLECGLEDFVGALSGQGNPFQLLMDGKLRVTGNMQIPMVLAGLLA
jgi:putative sterol carrier protein